jgi:hypothetical protein
MRCKGRQSFGFSKRFRHIFSKKIILSQICRKIYCCLSNDFPGKCPTYKAKITLITSILLLIYNKFAPYIGQADSLARRKTLLSAGKTASPHPGICHGTTRHDRQSYDTTKKFKPLRSGNEEISYICRELT